MAAIRVYVTHNLSLMVYHGGGFVEICTPSCPEGVNLDAVDIPLLIARLTDAAREMGVSTVQGELVKALRELVDEYAENAQLAASRGAYLSVTKLEAARQALAKAE